jgi:alkylation response protein AidB-like acyl-CoA dehydrogenase
MSAAATSAIAVNWNAKLKAAVPPLATREQALDAARHLVPRIAARANLTESERGVPSQSVQEILDAGLFSVSTPKVFGGSELGLATMVEVATILGGACGSTGWVYGVLTGHNWLVGLFEAEAQHEVFDDPRALTASVFRLSSTVVPVEGGYRMTGGQGRFCSGVDHSQWVVVGSAVTRDGAPPEPGFFLVPMSDVEIIDDWFTAGMRGTGSRSIRIADAFIPSHRMIRMADVQAGTTPGAMFHDTPSYKTPFTIAQPFSLIGALLGMGLAGLRDFADGQAKRMGPMPADQVAEQATTFARIADAGADIDAACALVLRDCVSLDTSPNPAKLSREDRTKVQRDLAYAAQKCRHAVNRLFEASGGSGIYEGASLQRIWRDLNSAAAHTAFAWDPASAAFGRAYVGLPASAYERR